MKTRDATEADLPRIVEIYNVSVATRMSTADTEPVTVESRLSWFRERNREMRPVWVMETAGVICGWLSFQPFHERPAYYITAEISVYVAPEHRQRGVGRSLLWEAVHRGPAFGLRNLVGLIFKHNTPSIQLFEGVGFQGVGAPPRRRRYGRDRARPRHHGTAALAGSGREAGATMPADHAGAVSGVSP